MFKFFTIDSFLAGLSFLNGFKQCDVV
jgi:hypothetical protein